LILTNQRTAIYLLLKGERETEASLRSSDSLFGKGNDLKTSDSLFLHLNVANRDLIATNGDNSSFIECWAICVVRAIAG
jgi:hypothetical protein